MQAAFWLVLVAMPCTAGQLLGVKYFLDMNCDVLYRSWTTSSGSCSSGYPSSRTSTSSFSVYSDYNCNFPTVLQQNMPMKDDGKCHVVRDQIGNAIGSMTVSNISALIGIIVGCVLGGILLLLIALRLCGCNVCPCCACLRVKRPLRNVVVVGAQPPVVIMMNGQPVSAVPAGYNATGQQVFNVAPQQPPPLPGNYNPYPYPYPPPANDASQPPPYQSDQAKSQDDQK